MKLPIAAILAAAFCSVLGHAQTNQGPFNTPQMNSTYYVGSLSGNQFYPTIQSAITAACGTAKRGVVDIPPAYTGTEPISGVTGGCSLVTLRDEHVGLPLQCYAWSGLSYGNTLCAGYTPAPQTNPNGGNNNYASIITPSFIDWAFSPYMINSELYSTAAGGTGYNGYLGQLLHIPSSQTTLSSVTPEGYSTSLVANRGLGGSMSILTDAPVSVLTGGGVGGFASPFTTIPGRLYQCSFYPSTGLWYCITGADTITGAGSIGVTTTSGVTTVAASDSLTPYQGIWTTRGRANDTVNAALNWSMGADYGIAESAYPAGQTFNVWYSNAVQNTTGVGSADYKVAVQYPYNVSDTTSAHIYPCTVSGSQTFTASAGLLFNYTCSIPLQVLPGTAVGVRTLRNSTTSLTYLGSANNQGLPVAFQYGTGAPNDVVNGGVITPTAPSSGAGASFLAITGLITKPGAMVLADSRGNGYQDTPNTGDAGDFSGAIAQAHHGYVCLCFPGIPSQVLLSTLSSASYAGLLPYATYAIDNVGINNNPTGPVNAAQVASDHTSIAALFPSTTYVYGSTIYNETTGTYTSLAGQTINYDARMFNDVYMRKHIPGETDFIDIAAALDPPNSGVFRAGLTIGAPTGTANTPDGVHLNHTGEGIILQSDVIKPALLATGTAGNFQGQGGTPCTSLGVAGCAPVVSPSGRGTLTCTAGGSITVSNADIRTTSLVSFSLNTAGGTLTGYPYQTAVTPSTSFIVKCGAADTSVYNYAVAN